MACEFEVSDGSLEFMTIDPPPPALQIMCDDETPMVTIRLDTRTVEYGPGYAPDKAARVFWEAMAAWIPPCPTCGAKGNVNDGV